MSETVIDIHNQFVAWISSRRPETRVHMEKISGGALITGKCALAIGLLDELSGFDGAVDWLTGSTGMKTFRLINYQYQRSSETNSVISSIQQLLASAVINWIFR